MMSIFSVCFLAAVTVPFATTAKKEGVSYVGTSAVYIDELSLGSDINATNLQTLYNKLYNSSSATLSNVSSLISSYGVSYYGSTVLQASRITSRAGGVVLVKFGGLEWQVTSLTKDISGNVIATLWLSDCEQEAFNYNYDGTERTITDGLYHGFTKLENATNNGLYSDWSADWSNATPGMYPANMYGTSYVRVVTLNNGGRSTTGYATSNSTIKSFTKDANSVFAKFTMTDSELTAQGSNLASLTPYLVTPSKIKYQETQSATQTINMDYRVQNDAYGTPTAGSWYSSEFNYAGKTGYTDWMYDTLWLPSSSETGISDSQNIKGIWGLSDAERRGVKDGFTGYIKDVVVGSQNENITKYVFRDATLRSGNRDDSTGASNLSASGTALTTGASVRGTNSIRPAIHLNLTYVNAQTASPVSMSSVYAYSIANQVYSGSAITPNPKLTYGGTTLTKGVDYTLSYVNNLNAGTATITITGTGKYSGTKTLTFTITPQDVSNLDITISKNGFDYDGTTKKPDVLIT